jgi:hypothetical protein
MSPFQALYEYPPPLLQQIPVPLSTSDNNTATQEEKENMLALLHRNLAKAQQRMKNKLMLIAPKDPSMWVISST